MEKLIYLVWDRPSRAGRDVRAQLLDDVAPQLLPWPCTSCRSTSTTTTRDMQSMVPVPDDELPVRACVSIWLDAHDTPRAIRVDPRDDRDSASPGYLVTESLYRDYGDNEHAPQRTGPTVSAPPAS